MAKRSINIDNCIHLYGEGYSLHELGRMEGVDSKRVKKELINRGVKIRSKSEQMAKAKGKSRKRVDIDKERVASLYLSGQSIMELTRTFGVSQDTITSALKGQGIELRNRSESEKLKWSKMSPEEREGQVRKAHKAAKNRVVEESELVKRANAREKRGEFDSSYERKIFDFLKERGIVATPQKAFGPYNCDLFINPVAVEIFGGQWHWTGRHLSRLNKRVNYLVNLGISIVVVCCVDTPRFGRRNILTHEAAEYIISFIDEMSRHPTSLGEYRVIRGNGELLVRCCSNFDKSSLVPSFTVTRDSLGRYQSFPN